MYEWDLGGVCSSQQRQDFFVIGNLLNPTTTRLYVENIRKRRLAGYVVGGFKSFAGRASEMTQGSDVGHCLINSRRWIVLFESGDGKVFDDGVGFIFTNVALHVVDIVFFLQFCRIVVESTGQWEKGPILEVWWIDRSVSQSVNVEGRSPSI